MISDFRMNYRSYTKPPPWRWLHWRVRRMVWYRQFDPSCRCAVCLSIEERDSVYRTLRGLIL